MGYAGAIASVVTTALQVTMSAISASQQYDQAKANAKNQQALMDYNARQEQREARTEEAEAQEAARRQHFEDERFKSMQRAAYGKSGAAITAGSPLAVLGDTAADLELGIQDTHRSGARAYNQRMAQANSFLYQGQVARKSVSPGMYLTGVFSSAASGAGNIASSFASDYKYNSTSSSGSGSSPAFGQMSALKNKYENKYRFK